MKPTHLLCLLLACASQSACTALAEVAYDEAAHRERAQCDRLVSMSERQACMQRVNAATKQAEAQRKQN
jgi:hypothetical protein